MSIGGESSPDASTPRPLKMSGSLADDSLTEFLQNASRLQMYAQVQIAGGVRNGSFYLASGRIVVSGGDDVMQRRIAQHKIVELLRKSSGGSGSFQCLPLVNMANVDDEASISVDDALRAATTTHVPTPAPAPTPTPAPAGAPVAATPIPETANAPEPAAPDDPATAPAPHLAAVPTPPPTPMPPAISSTEAEARAESEIRPMRASQLRKMLRDSRASLEEHGDPVLERPELAVVVSTGEEDEASRSEALRSIIRRLAS